MLKANGRMIETEFKLIRSKRKSIALIIDSDGNLIVRAPNRMSEKEILNFINLKSRWIAEKQEQIAASAGRHSAVVIETGKSILFLGETYIINRCKCEEVQISNDEMLIPVEYNIHNVIAWMKRELEKILRQRVPYYAEIMNVEYAKVRLTNAKTRWGSCSGKNNLNFTWRLIMCPIDVIDYVIVHELSHVVHKNHSSEFWTLVKAIYPSCKEMRSWLKLNGKIMEII